MTHRFVLVLEGVSEPDDRIEYALFEAGCDDAILAFRNSVGYLEFDREADCLESAILSAVRDVDRADHEVSVSHVEPDDIVNASEIARRLEYSREYVRLLVQGSRGTGGFPSPVSGVTGKTLLWSWASVLRWLIRNHKLSDTARLTRAETIKSINFHLLGPTIDNRYGSLSRKTRD
jgi:hypothetical protein